MLEWVVEFGIGVADFFGSYKGFKSLAETWAGTVVFGERGHYLRVADDEGGIDALVFDVFADELAGQRDCAGAYGGTARTSRIVAGAHGHPREYAGRGERGAGSGWGDYYCRGDKE